LFGFAEKAESFWRDFEEAIDCDRLAGEFKRFALRARFSLIVAITWPVSSHAALSLSALVVITATAILATITVSVTIAIPVAITAASVGIACSL